MSDYIIPAIIFRVEAAMAPDDLKAIMTDIKMRTRSWSGDGEYKAVLGFQGAKSRGYTEIGATVPYNPDGMDDVLLAIPELTSVKRYHAFDMIDGREHVKRWKLGMKAPKPKPQVDPDNLRYGYDVSKIQPGLRHMIEPEAREQGAEFARLLKGFPFADMSPSENRNYIEMEVIAVLQSKLPAIYDANSALDGALVRELRVIADPDNQSRLPDDWHHVVGAMFQHNHPNAFAMCCKHISDYIAIRELNAKTGRSGSQDYGIYDQHARKANDVKLSSRDLAAIRDDVRRILSPGWKPNMVDGFNARSDSLKLAISWGWKVDLTREDVRILGHEARRVLSPGYHRRLMDMPRWMAEKMVKAWKIPVPSESTPA